MAFITRQSGLSRDLLLFHHPYAGVQIPAGTVEDGEDLSSAALREAQEESGLEDLELQAYLGCRNERLTENMRVVLIETRVYSRPDLSSFNWAHLRRGIQVSAHRQQAGFLQVSYTEMDDALEPAYISYQITGWAPEEAFGSLVQRHFFHLRWQGTGPDTWRVRTDQHTFQPFWAPLDSLPAVISSQAAWLDFLRLGPSE